MTLRAFPMVPSARRSGASWSRVLMLGAMFGAMLVAATGGTALAQSSGKSAGSAGGSSGGKTDAVCASYGPGFQRVPGTDSCVRTGAAVRTDVYGGTSISSAPNQFSGSTGSALPATDTTAADPWKTAR